MENDQTKVMDPDDGMTRAVFDFGPPDETLNEVDAEAVPAGSTSLRSEQLRLNRHFLEDAAPFELEGFAQKLEAGGARIQLHEHPEWSLPHESLILLRGERGSGKSCLLMNLMLRASELYPQHHFLYYSFERSKVEVFMRLLLLGSQQVLPGRKTLDEHLGEWRRMLLTEDPEVLKKRSTVESPLAGLAYMLQNGHRIHVVDRLGDTGDVVKSLETFSKSLPLTLAFIDGGDWLLHLMNKKPGTVSLPFLLAQLRKSARILGITIVMSLGEDLDETRGSSTLYAAVGHLSEPWGGGDGAMILDWMEPGHDVKLEIPMIPSSQRIIWNRLREADEIE